MDHDLPVMSSHYTLGCVEHIRTLETSLCSILTLESFCDDFSEGIEGVFIEKASGT
jgi:hypothetical protein